MNPLIIDLVNTTARDSQTARLLLARKRRSNLSRYRSLLKRRAEQKHGKIVPCTGHSFDSTSYTRLSNYYVFWYNTPDGSTHIERELLN